MWIAAITLVAVLSVTALYVWGAGHFRGADKPAPDSRFEVDLVDGPGWFVTMELGR